MLKIKKQDHYQDKAKEYAKMGIVGTAYLAYRDVPNLFNKYGLFSGNNKKILDFGCGSGRSLNFLKQHFHEDENVLVGADISEVMIENAKEIHPHCNFHVVNRLLTPSDKWSIPDKTFDLVFSTLVLFEIPTLDEMTNTLKEIRRILKEDGLFIASTGTPHLYDQDKSWVSVQVDFNQTPAPFKSGDKIQVFIKEAQIYVTDYFWKESDYETAFANAGFSMLDKQKVLGNADDGFEWESENKEDSEPFVVYALRK